MTHLRLNEVSQEGKRCKIKEQDHLPLKIRITELFYSKNRANMPAQTG